MRRLFLRLSTVVIAALCFGMPGLAAAQGVAEFYRQKTINFIIVFAPGGTYDFYGRLVATHFPKFIPGNPKMVVQHMPGAGGLNGALRLATQSAQDGTELGIVAREIAVNQVLRSPSVPLDASKFQWIGSVSSYSGVLFVAGRTGVRTAADLRRMPAVAGSWGVETSSYTVPKLLNALADTKFKVVTGYRGAAEVDFAIESGEVDGRISSWSTLQAMKSQALAEGKLVVVAQTGIKRHPDLPNIPLVVELATTAQGRRILEFVDSEFRDRLEHRRPAAGASRADRSTAPGLRPDGRRPRLSGRRQGEAPRRCAQHRARAGCAGQTYTVDSARRHRCHE